MSFIEDFTKCTLQEIIPLIATFPSSSYNGFNVFWSKREELQGPSNTANAMLLVLNVVSTSFELKAHSLRRVHWNPFRLSVLTPVTTATRNSQFPPTRKEERSQVDLDCDSIQVDDKWRPGFIVKDRTQSILCTGKLRQETNPTGIRFEKWNTIRFHGMELLPVYCSLCPNNP